MAKKPPLILFTLPAVLLCLALGVWQVQRLSWKNNILLQIETRSLLPPLDLAAAQTLNPRMLAYRAVRARGAFLPEKQVRLFRPDPQSRQAYRFLTAFRLEDGRFLLVDRGRDPSADSLPFLLSARASPTPAPAFFDPPPDTDKNLWFRPDPQELARHLGISLALPLILRADSEPIPRPRNPHLQYAITWFALAAAFTAMHLAFVFTPRKTPLD